MLPYHKANNFYKKFYKNLTQLGFSAKPNEIYKIKVIATYAKILQNSDVLRKPKDFIYSSEFNNIINAFKDNTPSPIKFCFYKNISKSDLIRLSNFINNKKILTSFNILNNESTSYTPKQKSTIVNLLNNIVYLYCVGAYCERKKRSNDISEQLIKNFTCLLEINKHIQAQLVYLFPKKSNEVVIFINSLLDIQ